MSVMYYEGERVCFRPIEPEDAPLLQQWVNDPQVWATLNHRSPISLARKQSFIAHANAEQWYYFGIVVCEQDRLIGTCGLGPIDTINRSAGLGMVIGDREMQNHGYGSAATRLLVRFGFEELNLNRIELCVFDSNSRAVRIYETAGFTLEGRHRQALYRHGRYHDELRYAILRSDWQGPQHSKEAMA